MTRPPLVEVISQWGPPDSDPWADPEDWVQQWHGASLRVVRSAKRKRKLKKRGVELIKSGPYWLWFVERKER